MKLWIVYIFLGFGCINADSNKVYKNIFLTKMITGFVDSSLTVVHSNDVRNNDRNANHFSQVYLFVNTDSVRTKNLLEDFRSVLGLSYPQNSILIKNYLILAHEMHLHLAKNNVGIKWITQPLSQKPALDHQQKLVIDYIGNSDKELEIILSAYSGKKSGRTSGLYAVHVNGIWKIVKQLELERW